MTVGHHPRRLGIMYEFISRGSVDHTSVLERVFPLVEGVYTWLYLSALYAEKHQPGLDRIPSQPTAAFGPV
jgi:hypothetical protein